MATDLDRRPSAEGSGGTAAAPALLERLFHSALGVPADRREEWIEDRCREGVAREVARRAATLAGYVDDEVDARGKRPRGAGFPRLALAVGVVLAAVVGGRAIDPTAVPEGAVMRSRPTVLTAVASSFIAATVASAQCATGIVGFGAGEAGETGSPNFEQSVVPDVGVSFTQFSGGIYHSAGLLSDGTIVCWGDNAWNGGSGRVFGTDALGAPILAGTIGQRVQIQGTTLTGIVEVRAGELHTAARRADGSVVVWGGNWHGQRNVPNGLVAARIDAGSLHTLALRVDGSIACWGWCHGEAPGADQTGFIGIATGYEHSLAWRNDGTLRAWGRNDRGQSSVPSALPAFVQADAGVYHSIILGADGVVRAWGDNTGGQCGGTNADGSIDVTPGDHLRVVKHLGQPLHDIVGISAGGYHSLALRSDGSVVSWGAGAAEPTWPHGQTSVPSAAQGRTIAVEGGYVHSLVETVLETVDCDANGRVDCVEIALGQAPDSNSNGVPDGCECVGGEISVPGDFATIQDAIDAAGEGCVIRVAPGTYAPFDVGDKRLVVESTDGPLVTTIDAAGQATSAVRFGPNSTFESVLRGFTIRTGSGTVVPPNSHHAGYRAGGGVFLLSTPAEGGGVTIEDCDFVGASDGCGYGAGIYVWQAGVAVRRCRFAGLSTEHFGPAIYFMANPVLTVPGSPTLHALIEDCFVTGCTSYNDGGIAAYVNPLWQSPVGMRISRCEFADNHAWYNAGAILIEHVLQQDLGSEGEVTVEDCIFRNNSAPTATAISIQPWGGSSAFQFVLKGSVIADPAVAVRLGTGQLAFEGNTFCAGTSAVAGAYTDLGGNLWSCPPEEDCDGDGVVDLYATTLGVVPDANDNSVPDSCEPAPCLGDLDGSGAVTAIDLAIVLSNWGVAGPKYPQADVNGDGLVDALDLAQILSDWGPCPK